MIPVATFLLYSLFVSLLAGGPVTAHGVVLDGEGRPVAGAEVRLERSPRDGILAMSSEHDEVMEEEESFRAVTSPDGHFAIAALSQTVFDLEIQATGSAPLSRLGIQIPADRTTVDLGSFRLRPGATVVGQVTDPRGRPIQGAAVWLQDPDHDAPVAESGPDGRFVLRDLDPQKSVWLGLCQPGFLSGSIQVAASSPEVAHVVLEPAARLAGRVIDPQGSPVAGAEIFVYREEEESGGSSAMHTAGCPPGEVASGASDEEGRFRLESLFPGRFQLKVQAVGYPMAALSAEASPSGPELTVELRPGAVLAGRVLDTDGRPISGASIHTRDNVSAESGSDGSYRLAGVEPGVARVRFSHPDHQPLTKTLRIEPGGNRFDAQLPRTPRHSISGRVLDPQGRPVAGAHLLIDYLKIAETSSDGSFVLQLEEGEYVLESQAASYAPAQRKIHVADRPVQEIELRLSRGITLTGRLLAGREDLSGATVVANHDESSLVWTTTVDAAGRYRLAGLFPGEWSVIGATDTRQEEEEIVLAPGEEERVLDLVLADVFEVRGRVAGPEGEPVAQAMVHLSGSDDGAILPTEADGSFSALLREGTYQAKAEGYEAGYSEAAGPSFELRGGPVEGIEIQLPKGITLRGRLGGLAADALHGVRVEASNGPERRLARSNREGGYRLPGLFPGAWEVTATHGLATATGQVLLEPGRDEAVLDLTFVPGSLTLSGRIADAADLPSLSILLERVSDGQSVSALADEQGAFRLEQLPPGTYRLSILGDGLEKPYKTEIEISADLDVLIVLKAAAGGEP